MTSQGATKKNGEFSNRTSKMQILGSLQRRAFGMEVSTNMWSFLAQFCRPVWLVMLTAGCWWFNDFKRLRNMYIYIYIIYIIYILYYILYIYIILYIYKLVAVLSSHLLHLDGRLNLESGRQWPRLWRTPAHAGLFGYACNSLGTEP